MQIICHRGLWEKKSEQNGNQACLQAALQYDGMEIDLKNLNGKIVLSHDPIVQDHSYTSLESVLKKSPDTFYALNIKEDGLSSELNRLINKYKIKSYMCFDLSGPEIVKYKEQNLVTFDRFGDQDLLPSHRKIQGVVLDVFKSRNFSKIIKQLKVSPSIPLFIISPELHGQDPINSWKIIRSFEMTHKNPIYLCTDLFLEASAYFNR
jgi:glycerophosphoryl diester phosphodiesterase